MRYVLDSSWRRPSRPVVLAGSLFRIFRVTDAGAALIDRLEAGDDLPASTLLDRLLDAGAIHPSPMAASRFDAHDVTVVTPQLGGEVRADGRVTVDDGSVPPLADATVRLDVNQGPAAARNAGRLCVTAALIAFVDADVELLEAEVGAYGGSSWLDALLPHFDDPKVGLVAPRVLGGDETSLDLGAEPARIRAGTRVSYVPTAAIVVRAEAFDHVGGFDERLRFGEDVDFVWRLDQAGWRCRFEPASTVWHETRSTFAARLRQQIGYGSSSGPLAVRHPRSLAPYRSNGWSAAIWSLAGLGHPVVGAALAAGSAAALIPKLPDLPRRDSFRLGVSGHLLAGRQLATAVRRAWWPIAALLCLFSKRARWVTAAAIAVQPAALPNDLAFGWGLWRSMIEQRTVRPVLPQISSWPRADVRRRASASGRSPGRPHPERRGEPTSRSPGRES